MSGHLFMCLVPGDHALFSINDKGCIRQKIKDGLELLIQRLQLMLLGSLALDDIQKGI